jgi:hypothetical protein
MMRTARAWTATWAPALAAALLCALGGCRKDPCVKNCQRRAAELHCPNAAGCAGACAKIKTSTHCTAELKAFVACFVDQPTDYWECDGEGLPKLKPIACHTQQDKIVECLEKSNGQL